MTSKRYRTKKSPDKLKKAKVSPELLANTPAEIAGSPRLEMVTGLEEVEQKRMMIFVRHLL